MSSLKKFEMLLKNSGVKPFSFHYNGVLQELRELPWRIESVNAEKQKISCEVVPGVLRLTLELFLWNDYPVIEYTPYLENISDRDSGIISDLSVLDHTAETSSCVTVRYNNGSKCSGNDFLPRRCELLTVPGADKLELASSEARCSADFLPFLAIDTHDLNGINLAIGWTGAWKCSVERETETRIRIRAGMKNASFRLHPGEKVMQPGILLHFRENKTPRDGQNEFRRFMIAHHAPRNSRGELLKPPVSLAFWGGFESEKQIERIRIVADHQLPYEEIWIDAGWMGSPGPCPHFWEKSPIKSDWPKRVGSWEFNTWAHPEGLRPVTEAAHKNNLRVMVWFEALRVHSKSGGSVLTEHPEWLLGPHDAAARGEDVNFLLNIGIPEARQYLFDTISGIMEREGIDDYREDFNMDPRGYFLLGDSCDRTGITEMKFVEGVYLYWEEMRKKFPDMFIDNCASGGRRLDYKMSSMSFPLCQSDLATLRTYEEEYIHWENFCLDEWLPLHGTLNWGEDELYHAASGLGSGYGSKIWQFNGREPKPDHDYDLHRKVLEWGKRLRDIHLTGDIYPFNETPQTDWSQWHGQQIHDPVKGCGMVQLYRCTNAASPDFQLHLEGLCPEALYELEFFNGKTQVLSGREAASLVIHLDTPRSFQFISYTLK